jgi:hypothetical protein
MQKQFRIFLKTPSNEEVLKYGKVENDPDESLFFLNRPLFLESPIKRISDIYMYAISAITARTRLLHSTQRY